MTIRPATEADVPALQALAQPIAVPGVDYTRWTAPVLVAEHDGQVVGYVHALVGQPYAVITELAVDPDTRFKGVGARLLEGMELVLRVMGMQAWVGFMFETNPALDGLRRRATDAGAGHAFVKGLS